jgi:hypothetical protein
MKKSKKTQPARATKVPTKRTCTSSQSLTGALPRITERDDDGGFFISPLEENLTEEEVRRLWTDGGFKRDSLSREVVGGYG